MHHSSTIEGLYTHTHRYQWIIKQKSLKHSCSTYYINTEGGGGVREKVTLLRHNLQKKAYCRFALKKKTLQEGIYMITLDKLIIKYAIHEILFMLNGKGSAYLTDS